LYEEVFFWLSPAQFITVLVPVLKYSLGASIIPSKTTAIISKPLYRAVIL